KDRSGREEVAAQPALGGPTDLDVVVDLDAIVIHRHPCGRGLFVLADFRGDELDVEALPHTRRLAGVDRGGGHAVDRPALGVRAPGAVAVEDLHLVAALQVDAAVAELLPLRRGLVSQVARPFRYAELEVQAESTVELPRGHDVAALLRLKDAALQHLPVRGLL